MKTITTLASMLFFMGAAFAAGQGQQPQAIDGLKPVSVMSTVPHYFGKAVPWAVKNNYSGFVPAKDVRSESCELFDHKVVIKRQYGTMRTKQVVHLDTGGSFAQLSKQAFAEEIVEGGPAPCDGPVTVIRVSRWLPESGVERFTIYSSGGCGDTPNRRNGPASRIFADILGQYCPNTIPIYYGD